MKAPLGMLVMELEESDLPWKGLEISVCEKEGEIAHIEWIVALDKENELLSEGKKSRLKQVHHSIDNWKQVTRK